MPVRKQRSGLDVLRDFMEQTGTRIVLSALILVSLLPDLVSRELGLDSEALTKINLLFFCVFATEFSLRVVLLVHEGRAAANMRSVFRRELPFLFFDALATLSFLDWGLDLRSLRLFRLTRLVLLLGYWRSFLGDLWTITWRRETRVQLGFVVAVVMIGVLSATVVLSTIDGGDGTASFDYNDDGEISQADDKLGARLWWAFRQVQDPGNLVERPGNTPLVLISLILTLSGLLVFSFIVAVGTTVVNELVSLGRRRRLGLRGHVVVVGGGPHAHFLLEELVNFQNKRVLSRRIVHFGLEDERPAVLLRPELESVHYRYGDPASPPDLLRAEVDRAALVILLADEDGGDAVVVSRLLAVRQLNAKCRVVADVLRPQNLRSVREAGGDATEVVLTRQFVGLFLAGELLSPGLDQLFRELLTALGQELYLSPWPSGRGRLTEFAPFVARSLNEHGVMPLGLHVPVEGEQAHDYLLAPDDEEGVDDIAGVLVLARSAEVAADFGAGLAEGSQPEGAPTINRDEGPCETLELVPSPEFARLKRLLVCGFREEVGDLLEELACFCPGISVHMMVGPGRTEDVSATLCNRHRHSSGGIFGLAEPGLVKFSRGAETLVSVRIFEGDPASDRQLNAVPSAGHDLAEIDAVLFVADGGWGLDADAKSALGVLKLYGMMRDAVQVFRPGFRVVSELQEAGKGDLLEDRLRVLRKSAGEAAETVDRCTIVSTEKLRHYLLGQSVLVPGIASVYAELLSQAEATLIKLVPSPGSKPEGEVPYTVLVEKLSQQRLLPVAVELAYPEGGKACVNPGEDEEGHIVDLGLLAGIYCIAHPPWTSVAGAGARIQLSWRKSR